MIKILLIIFMTLTLKPCNSQTIENTTVTDINSLQNEPKKENQNGIVYFSYDNGINWVNSSNGLPEKIQIGLGGIATSNQIIGIATKDNGVYCYNFKTTIWENIPTDPQIIAANIGALAIIDSVIFVGTQFQGVFYTTDNGKNWKNLNTGLNNLTIRRLCEFNNTLYACTNDGFYRLNKNLEQWKLEFGQNSLQTNGATFYHGTIYLATNKGIFSQQTDQSWLNSSPQFTMHNISSDENQLFAMTYNELLLSSTDGKNWQSQQSGLPKELYTFNVLNHNHTILAGQWDGIYKKNNGNTIWELSSEGLPTKFAVTNLKAFNDILIISTSERKLKEGMTTDK
jgi:ligand-binding sensor domain-containing protein